MDKFFVVEVPLSEMRRVYKLAPTLGAYITTTNNRDDIQQFLNDKFSTFGQVYKFDVHEYKLKDIAVNNLTPIFWYDGHVVEVEDIEILPED